MTNHHHFLCGRDKELDTLLSLLNELVLQNDSSIKSPHSQNEESIDFVKYNKLLLPQKSGRDISAGSSSVAKTEHTLCTLLSEEDLSTSTSVDELRETLQLHVTDDVDGHTTPFTNDSKCQLILLQGPPGSGKRPFIHAAIHQYKQSLSNTVDERYKKLFQQNQQSENAIPKHSFLFVEGCCCRYGSTNSNKRSNLVGKEVPLKAFDDIIREIYFSIHEDKSTMEAIRKQFLLLLERPHEDIEVFTQSYPFMQSWFENITLATISSTSEISSNQHNKRSSAIVWNSQCILRQEIFIDQEVQYQVPIIVHFIKAVSNCIPIVLFLQEFHYVDRASISILQNLLDYNNQLQESKRLLVIASWDPDDSIVKSNSFLSFVQTCKQVKAFGIEKDNRINKESIVDIQQQVLTDSQKRWMPHRKISIQDYSLDNVCELVRQAYSIGDLENFPVNEMYNLAHSIFCTSNGNPLLVQFLLLYLEINDGIIRRETPQQIYIPNDIGVVISTIILRQDHSVQTLLKNMAALTVFADADGIVDCSTLRLLLGQMCNDAIKIAVSAGLLDYHLVNRCARFSQKEIQVEAYNLIPEHDRPGFHVGIGRTLWQNASFKVVPEEAISDETRSFFVLAVSHISNHLDHLTDEGECYTMSKMAYQIGTEAAAVSDYDSAAKLFDFAIRILGTRVWNGDLYETSLVLHNSLAQAYCYTRDDGQVQRVLDEVIDNARTFEDGIPACITLTYFQGSRANYALAVHTASNALKALGESVNQKNPTMLTVIMKCIKTKRLLQRKSEAELVNLQPAKNGKDIAVALFYCHASIFSYMTHPNVGTMMVFRILQLSIERGVSGPSAVAFAFYSFVLCISGDVEEGYRMSQVALKLADVFEEFKPRVMFVVYFMIRHWTSPIRDCTQSLYQAAHLALKCGDVDIFTACSCCYLLFSFVSGSSLGTLTPISKSFYESISQLGQTTTLLWAAPITSMIAHLSDTDQHLHVVAPFTDIENALKYAVKEKMLVPLGHIYVIRTIWKYLFGDYNEAIISAKNCFKHRKTLDHILTFYEGLAVLAASRTSNRRKYRRHGKAMAKQMKIFANRCPANFQNKQYLLEAEIASLNGNNGLAEQLYQQSIDKSKEEGFIHEVGIAFERWGYHQLFSKDDDKGKVGCRKYFNHARAAYEEWGATFLVRRIDTILSDVCK